MNLKQMKTLCIVLAVFAALLAVAVVWLAISRATGDSYAEKLAASAKAENENLKTHLAEVEKDFGECYDALEDLQEDYNDSVEEVTRLENAATEMEADMDALRKELTAVRDGWTGLAEKIRAQLIPFAEVKENLRNVGAPVEPEEIGVTRARFRETFAGVPYMRARYFGADLVQRAGLMPALDERLFGAGGVWEVR